LVVAKTEKRNTEKGAIVSSKDVGSVRWQEIFQEQDYDNTEGQALLIISL